MNKYYFTQNVKVVVNQTHFIEVEAESYEQALQMLEPYKTSNIAESNNSNWVYDSEYMEEAEKTLTVQENDYHATCELFDDNRTLVGDNIQGIVPDDDFLFDKFDSMLSLEYFKKTDGYEKRIEDYAIQQFEQNRIRLESLYENLKKANEGQYLWCDWMKDTIVNIYKLMLLKATPFDVMVQRFDKSKIIAAAKGNQEKPFGFVLDYLKSVWNIPKTEGWDIAEQVIKHFGIDNN